MRNVLVSILLGDKMLLKFSLSKISGNIASLKYERIWSKTLVFNSFCGFFIAYQRQGKLHMQLSDMLIYKLLICGLSSKWLQNIAAAEIFLVTHSIIYLVLHLRDWSDFLIFILKIFCLFVPCVWILFFILDLILLSSTIILYIIALMNLCKAVILRNIQNIVSCSSKRFANLYSIMNIVQNFQFSH